MTHRLMLIHHTTVVADIEFDDVESRCGGYVYDSLIHRIPNFWDLYDKYKETGEFPSELSGNKVFLSRLNRS